ncbi:MAG: hypothetical protein KF884_09890 [Fimbriimonadaceae bacterium]|nr:hypothetical protein [Fimbriimonadaceae bacterium]QYK57857.1 MAG: hypothetical protein KF884_09890 [Fimbriimonadaceae bacterium]
MFIASILAVMAVPVSAQWTPVRIDRVTTSVPDRMVRPVAKAALAPSHEPAGPHPLLVVQQGPKQTYIGSGIDPVTPADAAIAVGLKHVVVAANGVVQIRSKSGDVISESKTKDFLGDDSYSYFDPKLVFDPWERRFAMLWLGVKDDTKVSRIIVSAAQHESPEQAWKHFFIEAEFPNANGRPTWADHWDLGVGAQALYASGNQMLGADWRRAVFDHSRILLLDKQVLFRGGTGSGAKVSGVRSEFSPRSAVMYTQIAEWRRTIDGVIASVPRLGSTTMRLVKIAGPNNASPDLIPVDVTIKEHSRPNDALQPSKVRINAGDCRLTSVTVQRLPDGNYLLAAVNSSGERWERPAGEGNAVRVYFIDPYWGSLKHTLVHAAQGQYRGYPGVAADKKGNVLAVYTVSGKSPEINPSLAYLTAVNGVADGSDYVIKSEKAYEYKEDGVELPRWGDYTAACLDGGDLASGASRQKIWLFGMVAESWRTWDTRVAVSGMGAAVAALTKEHEDTIVFVGPVGGPFEGWPADIEIGNTGEVGLAYRVQGLPVWLAVRNGLGEVVAGGKEKLTFELTAEAGKLNQGIYPGTATIRDVYNGSNLTVRFRLVVLAKKG